jgi:ATP-dependent 26S proteasome regulatory subunit
VHRLAPASREDVILPENVLALLERNVFRFFAHRERLRDLEMPLKKGLLFYGPPGTGKTLTIRYLAGALKDHTTLLVTAGEMGALAEYMALARLLSPAMVVIEDVDLIARTRENLEVVQESLLNRLLNEMDGLRENTQVLFVLTTNRVEALEAALAGRPGRIDQAIEFPLPDAPSRRRLFDLYRRKLAIPSDVMSRAIERTEGMSAAFIKELVRRVALLCIERDSTEATLHDLDTALGEMLFDGGTLNAKLLGARLADA